MSTEQPEYSRHEEPDGEYLEEWRLNGQLHRTDGPAYTYYNPDGTVSGTGLYLNGTYIPPKKRKQFNDLSLVYICSPYTGDTERNTELARRFCTRAVDAGMIPLAPHLHYPQFMDDTDPTQRELAITFNRVLLYRCDAIWVYSEQISHGMRDEIVWAKHLNLPIKHFDQDFQEVLP